MNPHYAKIRKVTTGSGAVAIQVGFYQGKNFQLTKHLGSSKDPNKIKELVAIAWEYIHSHSNQLELNFNPQSDEILFKRGIKITQGYLKEAYDYLSSVYLRVGFESTKSDILKHFAIIRVLEPASKAKSIELLEKYFGIKYKKSTAFRELLTLINLKEQVVDVAIKYARDNLGFNFSLVFYDVTTLYFETHTQDDFRLNGFSKDNKINQPQILIGLVVNDVGFPIYYDIFKGNTFEGKTIIPVILSIKRKYKIEKLTVVADAGMLSLNNLSELERNEIDFVVGARVGNLKLEQVQDIASKLSKAKGDTLKLEDVIYEYSKTRARKDKVDNDKQIRKANYYLNNPAKVMKRSMFLSSNSKRGFSLNTALIEKHRLLEGIKGYKTNICNIPNEILIARYKDLWKVEQSFRIAKSDLEARPIYHRKKESIEYHILIVFVALCMGRVIEMEKGESIRKVVDRLKDMWTITIKDEISGNSTDLLLNRNPH